MTEPTDKRREEAREVLASVWKSYVDNEKLVNTVASALSSRDTEIREVLEGLRYRHGCWCELPPNVTSPHHTCECDAARGLWERVQVDVKKEESNVAE